LLPWGIWRESTRSLVWVLAQLTASAKPKQSTEEGGGKWDGSQERGSSQATMCHSPEMSSVEGERAEAPFPPAEPGQTW
jgi:hypothetical protein